MNPEPPASVFASYSRKDAGLVGGLLDLFAAIDVPVFLDEQSIKPGRKWRVEIDAALEECQIILVFWCGHAAQSSEVRSEYERAISLGKRVVPVLIDHTALPPNLGEYQGVDLRRTLSKRPRYVPNWFPWWGDHVSIQVLQASFSRNEIDHRDDAAHAPSVIAPPPALCVHPSN